MDTDDLSEKAWEIIARAAIVSDTLKTELGARCYRYENEGDWLRGVRKFLHQIVEEPKKYVDYWDLEHEEGVTATMIKNIAAELTCQVQEILAKPMIWRNRKR